MLAAKVSGVGVEVGANLRSDRKPHFGECKARVSVSTRRLDDRVLPFSRHYMERLHVAALLPVCYPLKDGGFVEGGEMRGVLLRAKGG